MKKVCLIVIVVICLMCSCGTIFNTTYIHVSNKKQKELEPKKIDYQNLSSKFFTKGRATMPFYQVNAQDLKTIVNKSGYKAMAFFSYYDFCPGSRNWFDSIVLYLDSVHIPYLTIVTTDWYYQELTLKNLTKKGYNKPILSVNILKYGTEFHGRKRWSNFVGELLNKEVDLWGYDDILLIDNKGSVLFCGAYPDDSADAKGNLIKIFRSIE